MMRQRAGLEKLGELHDDVVRLEAALAEANRVFLDAAAAATDPDLPYRERVLIAPLARRIGMARQTLQSRLNTHRDADGHGPSAPLQRRAR